MGITIAVIAVALFVSHSAHVATPAEAQSASPSSAIPNLTGIWHRKGPLNGKPNAPAVPTNRAAGFAIPGQLFAWLGKVVKQDGTRLLPQRSQATPDWWKP